MQMARLKDLAFIKQPERWPNWPYLPVVSLNYPEGPCGILFADGKPTVIVDANVFRLGELPWGARKEKLKSFVRKDYNSYEELLKEWRVD